MTAQSGKHRTIRLPEDLVKRTDSVRGSVFRERWIRILLYRITGDLLVGRRTIVLEFGPGGKLLDGPRKPIPVAKEPEPMPIPWEDDDSLPDVERAPVEAVAGTTEAKQAMRSIPNPVLVGARPPIPPSPAPRLRLKRPEVKP